MTYEESLKQGKLTGTRCWGCGHITFPPRAICPACHGRHLEFITLNNRGRLIAFTVISTPPPLMAEEGYSRERPYCSGVVELEGGVRVTARILGADCSNPENIKIGSPVTLDCVSRTHRGEEETFLAFKILKDEEVSK